MPYRTVDVKEKFVWVRGPRGETYVWSVEGSSRIVTMGCLRILGIREATIRCGDPRHPERAKLTKERIEAAEGRFDSKGYLSCALVIPGITASLAFAYYVMVGGWSSWIGLVGLLLTLVFFGTYLNEREWEERERQMLRRHL